MRDRAADAVVTLIKDGHTSITHPAVITDVTADARFDVVLVTVRRDQLADLVPAIAALDAERIAFMLNQCVDVERIRAQVGADRTVFTFPGVGGRHSDDGAIHYLEISQQQTTVERRGGIEMPVVELLRSAGFTLDIRAHMADWLKTHAVFITVVSAAVLAHDGDSRKLADDKAAVRDLVTAVGEGFHALARQGVTVTPTALRIIFTLVPTFYAVHYWQGQLRGPLGTLAIAPHVRATRDTEFPLLRADVHELIGGHGPTPHLDRLLPVASVT